MQRGSPTLMLERGLSTIDVSIVAAAAAGGRGR